MNKLKTKQHRVIQAQRGKERLYALCVNIGATLQITNHQHHWRVYYEDHVIQWWPASGKVYHSEYRRLPVCLSIEEFFNVVVALSGEWQDEIATDKVAKSTAKSGTVPPVWWKAEEELCVLCQML